MKRVLQAAVIAASIFTIGAASADNDIKIAHIYGKTGVLAAYGQQLQRGLELGIDYATGGTNKVLGRNIKILEMDDQLNAGRTRALFQKAYGDEDVTMAIGPISSGLGLAVLPIAKQYQKIIMPEGVADSITGAKFNRYVVRIERNSSQDSISQALSIGGKGACAATIAQDYSFGHGGAAAFKKALTAVGGKVVDEEFLPFKTTDFTAGGEKVINALKAAKGCPSGKYIYIIWAGGANPFSGLEALNPERDGIHLTTGGNILAGIALYAPIADGATFYYYKLPKNAVNDWLVKTHFERYSSPPDLFTDIGFEEGQAIVYAIKKAKSTDTEKLLQAFEGLKYEGASGPIYIRPEDHQAMRDMFHFSVAKDATAKESGGITLKLVKVIKASEMNIPVMNK
jgi:branched-chain amino acid transport system substrate-binding protein